jgi:hypothetical protein
MKERIWIGIAIIIVLQLLIALIHDASLNSINL